MSSPVDTDVLTLYSGTTVVVAEVTPYGMTLVESGLAGVGAPTGSGTDTGTLSSSVTITVATVTPYGATLTETGVVNVFLGVETFTLAESGSVQESSSPSDAFTFEEDITELTADDNQAEGTLAESAVTLTVVTTHSDTGTLTDTGTLVVTSAPVTDSDAGTLTDTGAVTTNLSVYDTSDTDQHTLAEAAGLAVTVADDGTLDDVGGFVVADTSEAVTLSETAAITNVLATVRESGTLAESSDLIISGSGVLLVTVAASDALTLAERGTVVGLAYYGRPLGVAAVTPRVTATLTLVPVPVGAGDLP
jgi:hypothetical protein